MDPMATGLRYRLRRVSRQIAEQHEHIHELVRELEETGPAFWIVRDGDLLTEVFANDEETGHELYHLRRWRMPDGEVEELPSLPKAEVAAQLLDRVEKLRGGKR